MRDARRNYLVVGVFVLAMLGALIAWLALLAGRTGATDGYHMHFGNVMGIVDGTTVRFQGFPVGQVVAIEPRPERGFRVDVAVLRDWRIPMDSVARIASSGLLSAQVVDIASGTSDRALEPGARIQSEESGDLFAQLGMVAGELSSLGQRVEPLLDALAEEVPGFVGDARALIARLDATVGRIQTAMGESEDEGVTAIVADVSIASENLADFSEGLANTRRHLDGLLERADGVVARGAPRIDASLIDLHEALDAAARHAESIAHNLEMTSRNLNEFSAQLRRNPGVLLRGREQGSEP